LMLMIGTAFGMLQFARHAVLEIMTITGLRVSRCEDGSKENVATSLLIGALFVAAVIAFVAYLFIADPRPVVVGAYSLGAMLVLALIGMPIPLALMSVSYLGVWVIRASEQLA